MKIQVDTLYPTEPTGQAFRNIQYCHCCASGDALTMVAVVIGDPDAMISYNPFIGTRCLD